MCLGRGRWAGKPVTEEGMSVQGGAGLEAKTAQLGPRIGGLHFVSQGKRDDGAGSWGRGREKRRSERQVTFTVLSSLCLFQLSKK